jgi:hypothetical protein
MMQLLLSITSGRISSKIRIALSAFASLLRKSLVQSNAQLAMAQYLVYGSGNVPDLNRNAVPAKWLRPSQRG